MYRCVNRWNGVKSNKRQFSRGIYTKVDRGSVYVSKIQYTDLPTYKIKDYNGEEIQDIFYTYYKQRITKTNKKIYRIEKVIRKWGNKSLVKCLKYAESFNSWIDIKDLIKL